MLTVLSAGLTLGLGCSLILDPANSDDVIRCTNTDDCTDNADFNAILNDDYRLAASCSSIGGSGGGDIGSSSGAQVCAAIFNVDIGCNPMNFTEPDHPFNVAYTTATDNDYYGGCALNHIGLPGCRGCNTALSETDSPQCFPGGMQIGTCVDGSEPNADSICDGGGQWPTYAANATDNADEVLEGQDVMDQYCRSYFCSDEFVCNRDTFKCEKCDADKPYGEGGCGEMYVNGALSTVYQDADTLSSTCNKSRSRENASKATQFGEIPPAPGA